MLGLHTVSCVGSVYEFRGGGICSVVIVHMNELGEERSLFILDRQVKVPSLQVVSASLGLNQRLLSFQGFDVGANGKTCRKGWGIRGRKKE